MKIIRETSYDPTTNCDTHTTTYIAETLREYRTCKSVLMRGHYKFLCCLGDKGDKTALNIRLYNIYNDKYDNKKCFVNLYLIDCMEG